jgi:hypothetical protein
MVQLVCSPNCLISYSIRSSPSHGNTKLNTRLYLCFRRALVELGGWKWEEKGREGNTTQVTYGMRVCRAGPCQLRTQAVLSLAVLFLPPEFLRAEIWI